MTELERKALELSKGLAPSSANIERVARHTSPEAARWSFNQWELRARAWSKFGQADQMLFVREALEQATDERVAQYHASLFPKGELVADLTAGIGGDLLALARRGPATGFEVDSQRAAYARHNSGAEVLERDALQAEWPWNYAIADPARRVGGRRTLDPEQFEPNPRLLAERMAVLKLGLIKLSPLLRDSYLESIGPGLEFVSFGSECGEALVHCGSEAKPGVRAVHIESGATLNRNEQLPSREEPVEFFFEADPAAIRAHALGALASQYGLAALGDSPGYLTGSTPPTSVWLKPYRVMDHGAYDAKRVKALIRKAAAGVSAVKSRANVDVPKVEKELGRDQHGPVVALFKVGPKVRFALLRPI